MLVSLRKMLMEKLMLVKCEVISFMLQICVIIQVKEIRMVVVMVRMWIMLILWLLGLFGQCVVRKLVMVYCLNLCRQGVISRVIRMQLLVQLRMQVSLLKFCRQRLLVRLMKVVVEIQLVVVVMLLKSGGMCCLVIQYLGMLEVWQIMLMLVYRLMVMNRNRQLIYECGMFLCFRMVSMYRKMMKFSVQKLQQWYSCWKKFLLFFMLVFVLFMLDQLFDVVYVVYVEDYDGQVDQYYVLCGYVEGDWLVEQVDVVQFVCEVDEEECCCELQCQQLGCYVVCVVLLVVGVWGRCVVVYVR